MRWLQQQKEGDVAEHGCVKDQDFAKEHTAYLQGFFSLLLGTLCHSVTAVLSSGIPGDGENPERGVAEEAE